MTRKLSLTTAVAVAALSVGAPAAFGSVHAQAEVAPNQTQRASSVVTYLDAHERGLATNPSLSSVTGYRDAFERGGLGQLATNSAVSNYKDAFERAVPPATAPVSVSITSGSDIEWPQVGVGLGIGLLLALGLGLIMRVTHIRPFAH
jgi:hypothetical protein